MSENRRIVRAAGLVGFYTLISRIAGLVRDAVIGYHFGTGMAADAFFVAFRIPNLLRRFVAEGAMSVAFVPVFTDYFTNRSRRAVGEAASALASLMVVALLALSLAGIILAPWLTAFFAPGFVKAPEKFALTVSLTRWVFPYVLLVSLAALCAGILNSVRHFAAPAISPIVLNLAMIGATVGLCPRLQEPVRGLAYGVLIGGVLQLGLQIPPLLWHGVSVVPRWDPRHEAVRRSLGLMGPMVFGAAVYQINLMISTMLASVLPSGSVSYIWYADRVFEFPLGIFAMALGTAALPSFAAQAGRGAHDELRQSLSFAVRVNNCIVLPATVGLISLSTPIVSVLFQRGVFGAQEVRLTANALCAFALGLWPVSLVRLLIPAFYAVEDARTPVVAAAAAFLANCVFSLLLMGPVDGPGDSPFAAAIAAATQVTSLADLRHVGLALATSLSATVNLVLLAVALRRRIGAWGGSEVRRSFLRSAVASLVMIAPVHYLAALADWTQPGATLLHAGILAVAVTAGVGTYVAMILTLGGEELRWLTAARDRLRMGGHDRHNGRG